MNASFLFNRLFEAKKMDPKTNLMGSEEFARKFASELFRNPALGVPAGITVERLKAADEQLSLLIKSYLPDNLLGDHAPVTISLVKQYLTALIGDKSMDIKKVTSKLKSPKQLSKNDDGLDTINRDLAGNSFKVPADNSFIQEIMIKIATEVDTALDTIIDEKTRSTQNSYKEFDASVLTAMKTPADFKFLPLTAPTGPDVDRGQKVKNSRRAMVAYACFIFPFLPKNVVKDIFLGAGSFFAITGERYRESGQGVLLTAAAFDGETDFTAFKHITNPRIREALLLAKKNLQKNPSFNSEMSQVGNILVTSVKEHSVISMAVKKRIAQSIYYSLIASAAPEQLPIVELDKKFLTSGVVPNPHTKESYLSPDAHLNLTAAEKVAGEDRAILQGLHGKNARQELSLQYHKALKASGTSKSGYSIPNIDNILEIVMSSDEMKVVEDIINKWLDLARVTDASVDSENIVSDLKALVNMGPRLPSIQGKTDYAYEVLNPLLQNLTSLTKDDFDSLLFLKKQLYNFEIASKTNPLESDENEESESLSKAEVREEYKKSFEEFNEYLATLGSNDTTVIRRDAITSLMNLTSLSEDLKAAETSLKSTAKSERVQKSLSNKKELLARKLMPSVTRLVLGLNFESLFTSKKVIERLTPDVLAFAKLLNPNKLTEPIDINGNEITKYSSVSEIAEAIMSLIMTSSKSAEEIIHDLQAIKVPSSYNTSTVKLINKIVDEIRDPSFTLGPVSLPLVFSAKEEPRAIVKKIRNYIKTNSTDASSAVISDLLTIPVLADKNSNEHRQLSIDHIQKTLDTYSPVEITLRKIKASRKGLDMGRAEARKYAEVIIKKAEKTLSELLREIWKGISEAPITVQLMLKNSSPASPEVLREYIEKMLLKAVLKQVGNESLIGDLGELLKVDVKTLEQACAIAAQDIVYQSQKGTVYKDTDVSPAIIFDNLNSGSEAPLSRPVSLLINLAAAIKTYGGISMVDGMASYKDISIDTISAKYGILSILNTLNKDDVPNQLATNPALKLCVQRYFFSGILNAFNQFTPTLSSETFIDPDITSGFLYLPKEIDSFISDIKNGVNDLNKLIELIDKQIISSVGGSKIPVLVKDPKTGNLIPSVSKRATFIPATSTDPAYPKAILDVVRTVEDNIPKTGKSGALSRILIAMGLNPDVIVEHFTDALDLIHNTVVMEIGRKEINVDEIIKHVLNQISQSNPENTEELLLTVNTLHRLAGSLDTALQIKPVIKGTGNLRGSISSTREIMPLVRGIVDLFSFDTENDVEPETPANEVETRHAELKKLGEFEKSIPGGRLNRTNYAALHNKETLGAVTNKYKIADTLGISLVDIVKSATEEIYTPIAEASDAGLPDNVKSDETSPTLTQKKFIPNLDELEQFLAGQGPEPTGFYEEVPITRQKDSPHGSAGQTFTINKKVIQKFQSTAKRIYGGYTKETTKGGQQHGRFANVKSYREYLNITRKATVEVLGMYELLYTNKVDIFADQYHGMETWKNSISHNLTVLDKALVQLEKVENGVSVMDTIEGQKEFFTILTSYTSQGTDLVGIIPLIEETQEKEVPVKTKTKAGFKMVKKQIKIDNPILQTLRFSGPVKDELNTMGIFASDILMSLRPLINKEISWPEILASFNSFSNKDRYTAAVNTQHADPSIEITSKKPVEYSGPRVTIEDDKFLHVYIQELLKLSQSVLNFITKGHTNKTITANTDITKIEGSNILLSIYGTLFTNDTYDVLDEAPRGGFKQEAKKLMELLTVEDVANIEQAIKITPPKNLILEPLNNDRIKKVDTLIETGISTGTQEERNQYKEELIQYRSQLVAQSTVTSLDNPFRLVPRFVYPSVTPETVQETIKRAFEVLKNDTSFVLLEELEAAQKNKANTSKEVAMQLYGHIYRANNTGKLPEESEIMPSYDLMKTIEDNIATFLWILPLLSGKSSTLFNKFKSIFNISDSMVFNIRNSQTPITCKFTNFKLLAKTLEEFSPIETNEPE